ncbi:hypothetical protein AMS68_005598 [Peltaster fructicola]|uniref:Uncharacterized protein n=1 Tax=Peltaster fructicola TaxID=286661 RepID=A0A6H0XZI1_9PEZI|nr:hypothetical protein AMS68_005598 [Peltaster fructicola]
MNSRTAYPPSYHHATKTVAPAAAQEQLAAFLAKTPTTAYLHPDAILSQTGIQFPAQSGPQGGLALHHLRRIEAGLRGENLIAESNEDLKALFATKETQLPAGDDAHLDALIDGRPSKRVKSAEKVEKWQDKDGAMDPDEYALQQDDVEEEMGADTLATTGEQLDSAPDVKTSGKSQADKAARKAAKKAKKKQQREAAQNAAG